MKKYKKNEKNIKTKKNTYYQKELTKSAKVEIMTVKQIDIYSCTLNNIFGVTWHTFQTCQAITNFIFNTFHWSNDEISGHDKS